ncbi:MAG: T9SS type A sorting domain-containing protein, partial [Bacteroidales bacterium]|nr:T9SS type A sorting domain-containing protein [Bacteroidales bacterium]
ELNNGNGHKIYGVTLVNGRHFAIRTSNNAHIQNIKIYGYRANNDGIKTGSNSKIENSFFKCNDDHIKLYAPKIKVRNCVFYEQTNGAVFQFAWNNLDPGDDCLIENIEVVAWEANCGDPAVQSGGIARSFINHRESESNGKVCANTTFRNIYIQGQIARFVCLNGLVRPITYKNLTIENVTLEQPTKQVNWIYASNGGGGTSIEIKFKNVRFGNRFINNSDFKTKGTTKFSFDNTGSKYTGYMNSSDPASCACNGSDTKAPTVPGTISFSNISKTSIKVSWGASTDNVGVTGYDVFMNNSAKTTVTGTSAVITGLDCNTSYSFKVRAKDAAGNKSAFNTPKSASTSVCSNGQPVTVKLSPINDAYLQGKKRYNVNLLRIEPKKRIGYLMFDLSSVSGTITSAQLKLRCTSDAGNGNVKINLGKSNNWTENNLSSKNKPAAGAQLATKNGAYKIGTVYTWNLNTASINGGGKVSFILTQTSGNDMAFGSKENAANKPVLEITYQDIPKKAEISDAISSIRLFPNPSNGFFNINLNNHETAMVKIMNLAGEVVYLEDIDNVSNQIDASHLSSGVYMVIIKSGSEFINEKIIIR